MMTKTIKKLNWKKINQYVDDGLLIKAKHPIYDLWIINYSRDTVYNKKWDEYTTFCRGIVIDSDGYVIARTIPKFNNFEEHHIDEIPKDMSYEITEKLDGSLGILFYYKNEWVFASRGSFDSEVSNKFKEIFNNKYSHLYYKLDINFTYLFEVIYKEGRIVVNYGDTEDCVLLTVVNRHNGYEPRYSDFVLISEGFNITKLIYVPPIQIEKQKKDLPTGYQTILGLYEYLKNLDIDNKEGFVIRFENGFRVKIKFENYVHKHYLRTHINEKTVWTMLKDGEDYLYFIETLPDEYYDWFTNTVAKFRQEFNEIERKCLSMFYNIVFCNGIFIKKEFAEIIKDNEYKSVLFNMFDRKNYDQIIWKMLDPRRD